MQPRRPDNTNRRYIEHIKNNNLEDIKDLLKDANLKLTEPGKFIDATKLIVDSRISNKVIEVVRESGFLPKNFKLSRATFYISIVEAKNKDQKLVAFCNTGKSRTGDSFGLMTPADFQKEPHIIIFLVHSKGRYNGGRGRGEIRTRGAVIDSNTLQLNKLSAHVLTKEEYNELIKVLEKHYPLLHLKSTLGNDPTKN